MKTKLVFNIGEKLVKFTIEEFQDNVDIDRLLKTDYGNLVAELITFPVILNKLGILEADINNEVRLAKLNLEVRKAKLSKAVRISLSDSDEKGKVRKPTVAELDDALSTNRVYIKYQQDYFEAQKQQDYISSIYKAAKSKSDKLDKLSLTLRAGDIDEELVQKQFNNLYYKIKDNN